MNEKINYKIQNLQKAFDKLEEFIKIKNPSEIERAGIIQAFEFTFELFWKFFKTKGEEEGIQYIASPKTAFKYAFQAGFIQNEKVWLDMLVKRNLTVHTYNEKEALLIYTAIKDNFIIEFKTCLNKIHE